ncbi:MAG TPA: Hsp70 family protein [Stellaceae bacterium]|nr:Hsp70 family protein [Stellaceae bacterium]
MLKTPEHIRDLERLQRASLSPNEIAKFIEVIRNDWGFNIYRAVSDTKVKLSVTPRADFVLMLGDIKIEEEISRADFESWIADDIARIELTVDRLLETEGVRVDDIDSVFLTGGSSFIPAVRCVFEAQFGAHRLADGENSQSVAFGLALIGLEDDLEPWQARCGDRRPRRGQPHRLKKRSLSPQDPLGRDARPESR